MRCFLNDWFAAGAAGTEARPTISLEAKHLNIYPTVDGTFPVYVGHYESKIASKSGNVQGADFETGIIGAGVFYYAESLPNCLVWHLDRI